MVRLEICEVEVVKYQFLAINDQFNSDHLFLQFTEDLARRQGHVGLMKNLCCLSCGVGRTEWKEVFLDKNLIQKVPYGLHGSVFHSK